MWLNYRSSVQRSVHTGEIELYADWYHRTHRRVKKRTSVDRRLQCRGAYSYACICTQSQLALYWAGCSQHHRYLRAFSLPGLERKGFPHSSLWGRMHRFFKIFLNLLWLASRKLRKKKRKREVVREGERREGEEERYGRKGEREYSCMRCSWNKPTSCGFR